MVEESRARDSGRPRPAVPPRLLVILGCRALAEGLYQIDGTNHWLWVFVNDVVARYVVSRSWGSKVPKALVGPDFDGVAVSDFFSAYSPHSPASASPPFTRPGTPPMLKAGTRVVLCDLASSAQRNLLSLPGMAWSQDGARLALSHGASSALSPASPAPRLPGHHKQPHPAAALLLR